MRPLSPLVRLILCIVAVIVFSSPLQATVIFTVPSQANVGAGYSVSAYDTNSGGPSGPPTIRIYKNGTLVAQGAGGTGYGTVDNVAGTISWTATSTFSPSVTKYTTIIQTNTPPIGHFDSLTASVTQGKTISAQGWAADNEMGAPITRVDVFLNGVDIANATLGGQRNDVANAYGRSDYTYSGWSWSYDTSGLALGTHTITVTYIDDNGATKTPPSRTFTVSTSVPTTSLVVADSTIYTGQSAQLTSITTDPGAELTTHYMEYKAPNTTVWMASSPNWATTGSSYWSGAATSQHSMTAYKPLSVAGVWTFRSRGRDSGNRYSAWVEKTVTVSTTPPTTALTDSDADNYVIEGDSITLTANSSDAMSDLTQVSIDEKAPGGAWITSKYIWTGSARSSYSLVKTLALNTPGIWEFRARGKDNQGVYGSYTPVTSISVASITSTSDFDGDGIPDWYEDLFSFTGLSSSNAGDATADFDGDGVSNKDEYTNPSNDPLNFDPMSWFASPPFNGTVPSGSTVMIVEPNGTTRGVSMPALQVQ